MWFVIGILIGTVLGATVQRVAGDDLTNLCKKLRDVITGD